MELIRIQENKLKIALSEEELRRYHLTVERFDYTNVETKRALWQMLDEAKREVGFDAADASLYVELYPSRLGGCEIFVTKLEKKRHPVEKVLTRYAVSFEESEALIAASAALVRAGYHAPSPLYRFGERFCLLLSFDEGEIARGLPALCEEFGEREEGFSERLEKTAHILSADAIGTLGRMILHHMP